MGDRPPRRLRRFVEIAESCGWVYETTADGHPCLVPPKGHLWPGRRDKLVPPVTFGKTPSDIRGDRNAVALLRRLGVPIPHKGPKKKTDTGSEG